MKYSTSLMLLGVFCLASMVGCKSFVRKPIQKEIPPGTPQFMLSIKGEGWGQGVQVRGALKEGMTIDDVLNEHDLKRKFKAMDIQIVRRVASGANVVKMPVIYKSHMKSIKPEQNYAIHANDQIIVKQVVETALDRFVDQFAPAMKR